MRTVIALARTEFRRLVSTRLGVLAFSALMTVPLLYGGLYLWANQDPYSNLDQVPVALVNEDAGTVVDGDTVRDGADVVHDVLDDGTFAWDEVDSQTAQDGIISGDYDFALTIPSDFSASIRSANTDDPRQARLVLSSNDANSYLASTIAKTAATAIRDSIAQNVGKEAADQFLIGLDEIRTQLQDAANGASDLEDGAAQLQDGAQQLADGAHTASEGSTQLADGTAALSEGATKLSTGATTLRDSTSALPSQAQQLADGGRQVSTGAQSLAAGLAQLQTGTAALPEQTSQLADGADSVHQGALDLAGGTSALAEGTADLPAQTNSLANGAQQAADGAAQLSTGTSQLSTGLQQLAATCLASGAAPAYCDAVAQAAAGASNVNAGAASLADGTAAVADGNGQLAAGAPAITDGVAKIDDGAQKLATGSGTLADKTRELATGAATISATIASASTGANTLRDGATTLSTGLDTLAANTPALVEGIGSLADGASQLADGAAAADSGAAQLADGIDDLATGADTLLNGTNTLHDGTIQLRDGLQDGIDQIPATTESSRDAKATVISNPVDLATDNVSSAGSYGGGLAPYFIALATWIGMYALFLIIRPLSKRAVTAIRRPFRTVLGGWVVPTSLAVLQVIVLFVIVHGLLGIVTVHTVGSVLFMVLAVATYAAILGFLIIALGSVGQFFGLILMLVQLVSAGGTFPWQTLPGPLLVLHKLLPMSYVVDGLRQLMYGGDPGRVWGDVLFLTCWLVGAIGATYLVVRRMNRHRTKLDLRPSLIGG
ncbi:YhgE/Pip domain-containing protein [Humibacter sp. BT305]|nr:YhgE/Pip domain-containing protein [Humibacter sp. BT305]